jgi:hypothetical protein
MAVICYYKAAGIIIIIGHVSDDTGVEESVGGSLCRVGVSRTQAIRKRNSDRLAMTCLSEHISATVMLLYELAYHKDHTCGGQEEPHINRPAKGNTGDEPGPGQAIQEEVAETEKSRA